MQQQVQGTQNYDFEPEGCFLRHNQEPTERGDEHVKTNLRSITIGVALLQRPKEAFNYGVCFGADG